MSWSGTPGPLLLRHWEQDCGWPVVTLDDEIIACYGDPEKFDIAGEHDARLATMARNACHEANPENPQAVADALPFIIKAAKAVARFDDELPEHYDSECRAQDLCWLRNTLRRAGLIGEDKP